MQPISSAQLKRKPGLFPTWQPEYAARYIATFPVTATKRPAVKHYTASERPTGDEVCE
jgi:hypothetical protein